MERRDPAALAQIRNSIQAQRETCALRDIPRLVRRLEELYWQMQGERERGETPVPDLSNMEMYYEIGTDVVLAEVEFEDEAAYRKRYQDRAIEFGKEAVRQALVNLEAEEAPAPPPVVVAAPAPAAVAPAPAPARKAAAKVAPPMPEPIIRMSGVLMRASCNMLPQTFSQKPPRPSPPASPESQEFSAPPP